VALVGGVTCVSGHQNELLETPGRWAEILQRNMFKATWEMHPETIDLVGG